MKWILPEEKVRKDEVIPYLLEKRGISDHKKFLNPSSSHIHSPLLLHDIKKASETIYKAVKDKKKIFIHGDFDVDGVTATTIMWDFLYRKLGSNVTPIIPSRFSEGYGLSDETVSKIIKAGGHLIITVDCGVKDIEIVKKYADKIDFVITDHHTILEHADVPKENKNAIRKVGKYAISKEAKAVVHPKLNDKYPFNEICGSVVSWKVCQAINEIYSLDINMDQYIELAALGTVCDVMPLIDENRAIVARGIVHMRKSTNPGLNSLVRNAGVALNDLKSYHFGYIIGPRLNAAGRLEDAMEAVRLLSTQNMKTADTLSRKLNQLNIQRQVLTQKYLEEAESQISNFPKSKIIFVYGDKWPEGVVGLIAGKLSQKYNRPVLVASKSGNILKGSARSVENFNIAEAFKVLNKHLVKHGGHSQAAGFTLDSSALSGFSDALNEYAENNIAETEAEELLKIDVHNELSDLDIDFVNSLNSLEPFGMSNEEPLFALTDLNMVNMFPLGKNNEHLKIVAQDSSDNILEIIAFHKNHEYSTLLSYDQAFDIAGNVGINEWNGSRKVQMRLKDLKINKK